MRWKAPYSFVLVPLLLFSFLSSSAYSSSWFQNIISKSSPPSSIEDNLKSPNPYTADDPGKIPEADPNSFNLGVMKERKKAVRLARDASRLGISNGQARFIKIKPGSRILPADFREIYGPGLGLGPNDQMKLMKTVSASPNSLRHSPRTAKTVNYHFYAQTYKGIDVLDGGCLLGTDEMLVTHAMNRLAPHLDDTNLETSPALSESQALEAALGQIAGTPAWQSHPEEYSAPKGVLGIASKGYSFAKSSFHLVYRFTSIPLENPLDHYRADVDVVTGEVFNVYSNVSRIDPPFHQNVGSSGQGLFSGEEDVDFTADLGADSKYRLMSQKGSGNGPGTVAPVITIDARNPNDQVDEAGSSVAAVFLDGNSDNFFGDAQDRIAVSMFKNIQKTLEYFDQVFDWKGFDGLGETPILLYLDQDNPWGPSNAYEQNYEIHINSQKKSGCNCAVGLDEMAHEFTHGVMDASSKIINVGESGAINEGLADIFGTTAEFHTREQQGESGDWLWGGDSCSNPKGKRNIQNPSLSPWGAQPTVYMAPPYQTPSLPCDDSNDQCGVHANSSIMSHWFYLLVNGSGGKRVDPDLPGTHEYEVEGIGRRKAEDIAFYTMAVALYSPAAGARFVTFKEMREATILLAENLFGDGSPEHFSVMDAWHAVGVGQNHLQRLMIPQEGTTQVETWPAKLAWEIRSDDGETQVQYADNPAFVDAVTQAPQQISAQMGKTFAGVEVDLQPDTAYYWRMRAKKAKGMSSKPAWLQPGSDKWPDWDESPVYHFTTASDEVTLVAPGVPAPGSPSDLTHPWETKAVCSAVPGAIKYMFQISEVPFPSDQAPPALVMPIQYALAAKPENKEGPDYKVTLNLEMDTDYYVRAAAVGPNGSIGMWSNQGAGNRFKTSKLKVDLKAPSNNETGVYPWKIKLDWVHVVGVQYYKIDLSKNADPSASEIDTGLKPTSSAQIINLEKELDGKIYWAVTAVGPPTYDHPQGEKGERSDVRNFTIDYSKTKPTQMTKSSIPYKEPQTLFSWKNLPPHAESYLVTIYKKNADGTAGAKTKETSVVPPYSYYADSPSTDQISTTIDNVATDKAGLCWAVWALGPSKLPGASAMECINTGPSRPVLISPQNGVTGLDYDDVSFSWDAEWAPNGCDVRIWEGELGQGSWGGNPNYTLRSYNNSTWSPLKPAKEYRWDVIALGPDNTYSGGSGSTSIPWGFTTKEAPPPPPAKPCNSQQVPGGVQADTRTFELGKKSGSFSVTYTTYTAKDKIDVYYEGQLKWSSGCVGTGETDPNDPNSPGIYKTSSSISFNGSSTQAKVTVSPWCDFQEDGSSTAWEYTLNCP